MRRLNRSPDIQNDKSIKNTFVEQLFSNRPAPCSIEICLLKNIALFLPHMQVNNVLAGASL